MSGSKTNYYETALVDHGVGGPDYVRAATLYVALYTVPPGEAGGGTEVDTANWINYARVAKTNNLTNWPAAVAGLKANGTEIDFGTADIPVVSQEIVAFALLDAAAAGNMLYYGELLGPQYAFTGDATSDVITCPGHPFLDTMPVRVSVLPFGSLPTGIAINTTYYARDVTTDTLKLAATSGGAVINLTAVGVGSMARYLGKTVGDNDNFKFAINTVQLQEL